MKKKTKVKDLKYRLLADGTIVEKNTLKTVGYILSRSDLDRVWAMRSYEKQKFLID